MECLEHNTRAMMINTCTFSRVFGREPESYEEVRKWMDFIIEKENEETPLLNQIFSTFDDYKSAWEKTYGKKY